MRNRRAVSRSRGGNHSRTIRPSTFTVYWGKMKMVTIPIAMNTLPFWTSVYCLFMYYTETVDQDWNKLTYVAFTVTLANAVLGFPWFTDDSYTDVKVLLDYAQEILPLPCVCSEIWIKHEVVENNLIAYAHAMLGFAAFTFLVIYEYKRMDLIDLTMITNAVSLSMVACYFQNAPALGAALVCGLYYLIQKRTEECCLKHKYVFDYVMALFNVLSLMAFEPKCYFPPFMNEYTHGLKSLMGIEDS